MTRHHSGLITITSGSYSRKQRLTLVTDLQNHQRQLNQAVSRIGQYHASIVDDIQMDKSSILMIEDFFKSSFLDENFTSIML
ncbi:hypothetical protein T4A_10163 [Trichinella pseudospiralis]|uniref:Uncharacterized protein n=1 Tax=Trichinella pseudospiralis TaxID=6337 RepID=A0A0V1E734_TRIPS|nr:hypothetical protein T4A_10163 [Trichinella pseudospiralis]